jgi:hypothetical protein
MLVTVAQTSLLLQSPDTHKIHVSLPSFTITVVQKGNHGSALEVFSCHGAVNWRHRPKVLASKPPLKRKTDPDSKVLVIRAVMIMHIRLASRLMFRTPH